MIFFVSGFIVILFEEFKHLDDELTVRIALLILFIALLTGPLFPIAFRIEKFFNKDKFFKEGKR